MDDLLTRFWSDIADRVGGPLTFRFLFQPAVATLCAMRDGVADARLGRSSYAWALLTHPAERASLIREGARAVGRLLVIGIAMDLLYQLVVLHRLYPGELVFVVLMLVWIPYVVVREGISRLARSWLARRAPTP